MSGVSAHPRVSELQSSRPLTGAAKIGDLSLKLADAALIARERGDEVQALFFAIKAAETLQLAKLLGWKLPVPPESSGSQLADATHNNPPTPPEE